MARAPGYFQSKTSMNLPTIIEVKNIIRFGLAMLGMGAILAAALSGKAETPNTFTRHDLPIPGTGIDDLHNTVQIFQGIESPKALVFSPDDRYVVAYSNNRFSIYEVGGKREGKSTLVIPHSDIAAIAFSGNDVIVVTNPNGKQMKYDLTGKEITMIPVNRPRFFRR
jgi:hypothetical protein